MDNTEKQYLLCQPTGQGWWYLTKKFWVGLVTEPPVDVVDRKGLRHLKFTEVSGKAYRRIHMNQNTRSIAFPRARDDWGQVSGLLMFLKQVGDEALIYIPFPEPRQIKHKDYVTVRVTDEGLLLDD